MSTENNEVATSRVASFYSKNGWWYAAAALMLLVLVGAVALIVLPSKDADPTGLPPVTSSPVSPPLSSQPPLSPSPAATGWADLGCNGTEGSTELPTAPPDAEWEPVGVMSAPTSKALGPTKVSGFVRTCFQHTPAGALVAGINIITAMGTAPESDLQKVVETGVTPGRVRDQAGAGDRGEVGWKVAAFRAESCSPERCNLALVVSASGSLGVLELPMVWVDGDWRVDGSAPDGGGPVDEVPPGYISWGA